MPCRARPRSKRTHSIRSREGRRQPSPSRPTTGGSTRTAARPAGPGAGRPARTRVRSNPRTTPRDHRRPRARTRPSTARDRVRRPARADRSHPDGAGAPTPKSASVPAERERAVDQGPVAADRDAGADLADSRYAPHTVAMSFTRPRGPSTSRTRRDHRPASRSGRDGPTAGAFGRREPVDIPEDFPDTTSPAAIRIPKSLRYIRSAIVPPPGPSSRTAGRGPIARNPTEPTGGHRRRRRPARLRAVSPRPRRSRAAA